MSLGYFKDHRRLRQSECKLKTDHGRKLGKHSKKQSIPSSLSL